MEAHLKECRLDLDQLYHIFTENQPSHFEMRVAEWTLQVLIESAKHRVTPAGQAKDVVRPQLAPWSR
jgi:hypothetical protein